MSESRTTGDCLDEDGEKKTRGRRKDGVRRIKSGGVVEE